ncbi:MAG TPA: amidohydrolase [Gemmatimonadaceae bacterium]|nr:amidohydrolase [Gemmatimonadaceae bacterium]
MRLPLLTALTLCAVSAAAQAPATPPLPASITRDLDARIERVTPKVVSWRRDVHEHPELSNFEQRTAGVVAAHLKALGLEVRTNVGASHGVVGILRGGKPGPAVALRADMDALPVTEQTGLPFASKVTTQYNGQTVGVMHACGHDAHTAILMGVAEVLAGMKSTLPGSVTFLFQAAEEASPEGGALALIKGGALDDPRVEAVYGLHTWPGPMGTVSTRSGGLMASTDNWRVVIHGKQGHGAQPWRSIDPIVIGAQIVNGLQTIVSRSIDLTAGPAVVTVGAFQGGVRENIIPDSAVMIGTFRTFNDKARATVGAQIKAIAEQYAVAGGATATVTIAKGYPTTVNDPAWFPRASTVLRNSIGTTNVLESAPSMPAEDFSHYLAKVPGLFFFLGVTPKDRDPNSMPANHSPLYDVDEGSLPTGIKALSALALDALLHGVPAKVSLK